MIKGEMIEQRMQQINLLTATVDAQTNLIDQLNQTIQELKEQINKNAKNSSKPPSSDGYKKPTPKSQRKASDKIAGGQKSNKGNHLAITADPNHIIVHMPSICEGCQYHDMCKRTGCVAENDMSLMLS